MNTKVRLEQFAEQVKEAGLNGKSMQAKLAEIVEANDFTPHEISRIAEMANRGVQLGLYKVANDKRFKFELVDPEPLIAKITKEAKTSAFRGQTETEKVASALQTEGNLFEVPYRERPLSILDHPLDQKLAADMDIASMRELALSLDRRHAELTQVETQGRAEQLKIAGQAEKTFDKTVQSAASMIMSGVTLPSLYTAVTASVGGGGNSDEDRANADKLMLLVIRALKERGVPNHKMGFRHRGNIVALDNLSAENLLTLCQRSTGQIHEHDIPEELTKIANVAHGMQGDLEPKIVSVTGEVVQPYLDDKYVDNQPGGQVRLVDGENEFVVGIGDLIGDQSRMRRCHAANEYIGLKLKQIAETIGKLRAASKVAEAKLADLNASTPNRSAAGKVWDVINSHGMTNLLTAGTLAAPFVYQAMQKREDKKTAGKVWDALGSQSATNAVGIAGAAAQVAPLLIPPAQPKEPKAPRAAGASVTSKMSSAARISQQLQSSSGVKLAIDSRLNPTGLEKVAWVQAALAAAPLAIQGISAVAGAMKPKDPASAPKAPEPLKAKMV